MSETKTKATIELVVKDGLCTGCGTCAGICPQDAIELVIEHHDGIYVPYLDKEKCTECGLCVDVCPGHSVDFKQFNLNIFGKEPKDILLGNYLNCYTGHVTDYDIRYNSASGGLVTGLLVFALEEGIIDGALVTRMKEDKPLEPEPFIARTSEEIISASKSKYCPVAANIALKEILEAEDKGRFAVVGLSCHIHGVRKAERVSKKLRERIVLHLGLLCNHPPSFLATEYILSTNKINREEVKQLNYRGEGWPGKMKISLRQEDIFLQFPDYWDGAFGHLFYPRRCLLCCDQGNELADISFGDPWGLENDGVGKSLVISRSEIGQNLLQKAITKGRIELRKIERDRAQGIGFREVANIGISIRKLSGQAVPHYNRELSKPGLVAYLRNTLCYLKIYVGSKRFLWSLICRLIPLVKLLRFGKLIS